MPRMKLVDDLIADVRSLLDESNEKTVSTLDDILPSLNRAQTYAFDILAKHYLEPLLVKSDLIAVTNNISEITLPENIFEDRIQKVEFSKYNYFYECKRVSYRDITYFETPATVPVPAYYVIFGRTMRLVPAPDGSFQMRIWYLREPETLLLSQGRVTDLDTVNGTYIIVDNVGTDVTTEINSLDNFINIIDGQTGEIKQTLQVSNINGQRITFASSLSRTSVLNRTISSSLVSTVNLDDYICTIRGTCVPFFAFPIYNFMVQYTVNEMNRKLKNESAADEDILDRFTKQVQRNWAGREMELRIKIRSKHWLPRRARKAAPR